MKKLYQSFEGKELEIPEELCYLEGKYREMYLNDMKICQEFASLNRRTIAYSILKHLFESELMIFATPMFETIHNYIDLESNIVRKGSISARDGEKVLIPLNMRDGCILAVGKGNEDWNFSAPHGAGRIMSRSVAREKINLEDFIETMKGVYSTSVMESTIDESPLHIKVLKRY